MSSLEKPNWFDIPRESPSLQVEHGGEVYDFDYHNTTIYYYDEPYQEFNHIFHFRNGSWGYIFGTPELLNVLIGGDFPSCYRAWPMEEDVEAYIQSEMLELG